MTSALLCSRLADVESPTLFTMKLLTALYATVICLSAFLLFLLEPIAARQLLPLFGGSAAVWITCLVFFQCTLLAGYWYAHLLISHTAPRAQAVIHMALLTLALLSLELRVHPSATAVTWHPILSILGLLAVSIGLPFLTLAATSPLLQAWYSRAGGSEAPPWWLFALSNAGSLFALFLYPALIETHLALHWQVIVWAIGFCVFSAFCGALALQSRRIGSAAAAVDRPSPDQDSPRSWALWILLPGCASMLLCAVTNHLGENIAAIPLLWIVPLAAYLLSFIVAFASPRAWPRFVSVRMLALTLATFAYLLYSSRMSLPPQISIPVYTLALFFACLFCHGELYRLRPSANRLTGFYLSLSGGSAAGAILVGLVAPNFFHASYDLAITVILLAAVALIVTWKSGMTPRILWTAATIAMIYIAVMQARSLGQEAIVQLRSFYGTLRVTETHLPPEAETTRTLYHGRIQHGTQLFGNGLRTQPSSYYAQSSGVGLALDLCCEGHPKRIAVVGLGTGTVAAYGKPGDDITFYEIDPLVERLARALFTYLHDSQAAVHVVLGDARLSLARESAIGKVQPLNDVIVLDAFSGDAIPIHLLTAQAIALYRRRLRPDGVLVFNISSQYLDLAPELELQAQHAGLETALVHSEADESRGLFTADWLLMSANHALLHRSEIANVAQPVSMTPGLRLWTDDYSSLLPLMKWRTRERRSSQR
ncbi:integral membrane protein-like protein [Acidisarcina polymorpha]|uniref:Integral membrane protein-like protein n=1 Tax=Acidisarcina polymorpha TaxID=2211140 RepID=A0A2Z5FUZ0_9BACT|nr:fused MFS/spermidine synthase [Acidisarcina polymorpha]AXC10681.1 integral membrane protein-like protein [Acidisarcina polymorpha]